MLTKISLKHSNIQSLPVVPMRGVVLFPDTVNHFDVSRSFSIRAIDHCIETGDSLFLVAQNDINIETPQLSDLYSFGVVGEVRQVLRLKEDYLKVLVDCKYRAKLLSLTEVDGYLLGDVIQQNAHAIRGQDREEAEALMRHIHEQLSEFLGFLPKLSDEIYRKLNSNLSPEEWVEYVAFNLPFSFEDKQSILDQTSSFQRLKMMLDILVKENGAFQIEREINEKVKENMLQSQREYYLREQMRTISQELGEDPYYEEAPTNYDARIDALPIEQVYKDKLKKEAQRMMQQSPSSPEYGVIDQYLDTVCSLPWTEFTTDNLDIKSAQAVLDRDHYGLTDVKDRIIEYLAVRARTGGLNSQIICLVGPPGVGKTSIAKSLAEAMGRKFVRMSLGGVRDEAEIRGHRKTYVAAMPGRIISAIQQSGTANPLILLDEIDKLGNDYKGDPASALLEVLDPEQNQNFVDHYLDIPFDLSNVLFITTANERYSIPNALRDRMDVISLSSYTRTEKFHILKEHLLPKQMKKHGLLKKEVHISDRILYSLIDDYTSEAGVRNLERAVAKLLRKVVRTLQETGETSVRVTNDYLVKALGAPFNRDSLTSRKDTVGYVHGLAWTSAGGVLLPIETVILPGSGKITITGSLGDVMKESVQIALTVCKTLSKDYTFRYNELDKVDIHIHAPEGATPKDGPSAGVTITTALMSALTGIPVHKDVAMTGEITLQGRVLAIGGLKEKLLAAYQEKIHKVLIPKSNMVDLRDVPQEVLDELEIIPVDSVKSLLKDALVFDEPKQTKQTKRKKQ